MSGTNNHRPAAGEYAAYYERYVSRVSEVDVVSALAQQVEATLELLRGVPDARAGYRYAPGKWSIREVAGHMADTERIMAYRALSIGRGDPAPLPGMEPDDWMAGSTFEACSLGDLVTDLENVRRSTVSLFRNLSETAWSRTGVASDNPVSVRALAYIIAGHERHHVEILRTRYLGAAG